MTIEVITDAGNPPPRADQEAPRFTVLNPPLAVPAYAVAGSTGETTTHCVRRSVMPMLAEPHSTPPAWLTKTPPSVVAA